MKKYFLSLVSIAAQFYLYTGHEFIQLNLYVSTMKEDFSRLTS